MPSEKTRTKFVDTPEAKSRLGDTPEERKNEYERRQADRRERANRNRNSESFRRR